MATTLGKPAIPTPNALDLRALQTAISNTRERIEALEKQLGLTSSMAQTTAGTTTTNLNSILTALSALTSRVTILENATTTDVATFVAGEPISIGQCVVPIGPNNVGVADPNDTSRMFGVIGIAISNAASAGVGVQVQRRGVFAIPGATSFYAGHAAYVDTLGAITQTPDYDATAIPIGLAVSGSQIFIAPDWPALLQPTFSSGIEDAFEAYLPVTYRALGHALSLAVQIAALPFQSGADLGMEVPVLLDDGITAVRITVADIVALATGGGGLTPIAAGDLLANLTGGSAVPIGHTLAEVIDALPVQSGIEERMEVPVTLDGVGVRINAGDFGTLVNLEALIAGLPFQSGADASGFVPVSLGGIAVQMQIGDIVRLVPTADLGALIAATPFSSGVDPHAQVAIEVAGVALRVDARDIAGLTTLLQLFSGIPTQSGAESNMLVPVEFNGVVLMVTAGDIARLGGGAANLEALIDALPYQSGADPAMMVPVTIGGIAVRVAAGDIARLGSANVTVKSWLQLAAASETGTASVASALVTDRMPFDIQNLEVKASLTTAQATGSLLTVDIKANGVSIFSTPLTFNNTSTTTVGATTPAVISATTIFADDVITVDVTQVGDGTAQGLKVTIGGTLTGASGFFGVINGLNGKTVLTGTNPPSSGVGNDGDSFYDYNHFVIYSPKASGVWPSGVSLIGPTGPTNVTSVDVSVAAATILSIAGNPVTSASGGGTGAGTLTFGYSGAALPVANGGTSFTSFTIGDLMQASASGVLAKLAAVATGNALLSGGVGTVSSWGKIGLTTHITGTLAIANGGTGLTSTSANFMLVGPAAASGAPTFRKSVPADLNQATVALTDAATVAWAMGASSSFSLTLSTSRILGGPTGMADGQRCILRIKQSATGTCVITWPAIFKWAGGVQGVLTTTANAIDELEVRYQAAQNTFLATLTKAYA